MRHLTPWCLIAMLILAACGSEPSGVIPQDDMAELLADIHEGEAVVDINFRQYTDDSARLAIRQAILKKHDVTAEEFDSSLMWYGHNLDVYKNVYDNVITILEERQQQAQEEARKAGEQLIAAGDSVDVWTRPHSLIFEKQRTGDCVLLTFSYPADSEMKVGDCYYWRLMMLNSKEPAEAFIAVDYKDGSGEYQMQRAMPETLLNLTLQTDSIREPSRVYGYLRYNMASEKCVFVDKISLSRARLNSERYDAHPYQRKLNY